MKTYRLKIYAIVFAAFTAAGCSSDIKKNNVNISYNSKKGSASVSYNPEKGSASVALENTPTCNYSLMIGDYDIGSGTVNEKAELDILNQIKSKSDICKDVALLAAKNNNELQISISLTDLLDTMFVYHLTPTVTVQDENIDFSGVGAKVVSKSASRNFDDELKRWLYRRHEVVSDSLYAALRKNYIYLTETKNNDYVVQGDIPVFHSLSENKYTINCNMVADYYALVACSGQKFIEKFVENSVVTDYQNLSTTKNNLTCIPENNKSGFFCIVLLGINKDYSFQQLPIAVVALDNEAPNKNSQTGEIEEFNFKNNAKVLMPQNTPKILGDASAKIIHCDGNGLECNVTFQIIFAGDAKSLTVHRRGELCYPNKILGNHLPKADKVLYAKDGYHQQFTWKLHFEDGDNEIPITVEDYHGNKREYIIIHRAEFERNNVPQIDIDNNIDIYN